MDNELIAGEATILLLAVGAYIMGPLPAWFFVLMAIVAFVAYYSLDFTAKKIGMVVGSDT